MNILFLMLVTYKSIDRQLTVKFLIDFSTVDENFIVCISTHFAQI